MEERGATIVSMENVVKTYPTGTEALKGLNLSIAKGEFVFVVGSSGSGKSTFIKLLLREIEPSSGTLVVNGKDITHLKHKQVASYRRRIGCVFQDFRLLKDRSVYENVAFAQKVIGVSNRLIGQNVYHILSLVGLSEKAKAFPKELSGGEQQRVALARALVNKPAMLLADEPTGNLDPKNSEEIMQLLEVINKQGTTVIVVTHNNEIVNKMKKRVVTLDKGVLISDEEEGSYHNHLTGMSVQNEQREHIFENIVLRAEQEEKRREMAATIEKKEENKRAEAMLGPEVTLRTETVPRAEATLGLEKVSRTEILPGTETVSRIGNVPETKSQVAESGIEQLLHKKEIVEKEHTVFEREVQEEELPVQHSGLAQAMRNGRIKNEN